jgi:hypothetical protein
LSDDNRKLEIVTNSTDIDCTAGTIIIPEQVGILYI